MKTSFRVVVWAIIGLVFASGCSAFPGLRVLSGETSPEVVADTTVSTTSLVMGDKSGLTDPALSAAADRIEAANLGNIDIIEVRKDLNSDVFTIYMLLKPPTQDTTQADYVNGIRRAIELSWQGMLNESQGSNVIEVVILDLGLAPTLDKGTAFIGYVSIDAEIARTDAIGYLNHRPNTINDFFDLIAQGKLTLNQPTDNEMYMGKPNHSIFMLSALLAQIQNQ